MTELRRLFGAVAIVIAVFSGAAESWGQSSATTHRTSAPREPVAEARSLMELAERGDARAQARLGFMYATGYGVPQSFAVAAALYRRSAEHGNPTAQYLLGLAYDKGQGVPRDEVLAYVWLDLAAGGASRRDRDFYARLRDAVATKMTVAQVAYAQALAIEWAPVRSRRGYGF